MFHFKGEILPNCEIILETAALDLEKSFSKSVGWTLN